MDLVFTSRLVLVILLLTTLIQCASAQPQLVEQISKSKRSYAICYDAYNISSAESIILYGAREYQWLDEQWYWGKAGYGALYGQRAGYLEGGLTLGYQNILFNGLLAELRLFYGAGGGGSAPQGGGMLIQPSISIGIPFNTQYALMLDFGYIHFINGNISSASFGVSFDLNTWGICID